MDKLKQFVKMDLWVILLDIVAVNAAYFIALLLRFYVGSKVITGMDIYYEMFAKIAPWYTLAAIAIFVLFRLYGGLWTYAGLNDMNRILMASLATAAVQIGLSLILAGRMPVSYYTIGAFVQFLLITVIRFSYRFIMMEKAKIAKKGEPTVPALVVGSGDLGRKVIRHLEENTPYRAAVIVGKDSGRSMDGIPVVALEDIAGQVKAKSIKAVFVADKDLTKEQREQIRDAAKDLELNDFTGYMSNQSGFLPLTNLLDVMDMPIKVEMDDGQELTFVSAEECLSSLPGEYDITRVQASKLFLKKHEEDKSWMAEYRNQTGQDVSFF